MTKYRPIHSTRTDATKAVSTHLIDAISSAGMALHEATRYTGVIAGRTNLATVSGGVTTFRFSDFSPTADLQRVQVGWCAVNNEPTSRAYGRSYVITAVFPGSSTLNVSCDATDDPETSGWLATASSVAFHYGFKDSAGTVRGHNHNGINSKGTPDGGTSDAAFMAWRVGTQYD